MGKHTFGRWDAFMRVPRPAARITATIGWVREMVKTDACRIPLQPKQAVFLQLPDNCQYLKTYTSKGENSF